MLPLINQAISMGYAEEEILRFIAGKIPNLAAGINQATSQGFGASNILKFLSNKMPLSKEGAKEQLNDNDKYLKSVGLKTKEERQQTTNKFLKGALGVGAGFLGTSGLISSIGSGIGQSIGPDEITTEDIHKQIGTEKKPLQLTYTPKLQDTSTSPPPVSPIVTQTPNPVNSNVLKVFTQTPLARLLDGLRKQIKDPNDLAASVRKLYDKDVNAFEKANKTNLEDVISEYLKQNPEEPPQEPPSPPSPPTPAPIQPKTPSGGAAQPLPIEEAPQPLQTATAVMESPEEDDYKSVNFEDVKEAVLPKKKDTVATPVGIGEIRELNAKNALIDIGGKLKQVPIEDLETEPEEIKKVDFQKMAKDYISGIPEADRSTAMLINFFQPTGVDQAGQETGQFFVVFPSDPGHIGIYDNVPRELSNKINSASTAPKTSGKTTLGEHETGRADSRYAAADVLKKNPQLYPYKKVPIPYNLAHPLFEANRLNELERRKVASEAKKKEKKDGKKTAPKKRNDKQVAAN